MRVFQLCADAGVEPKALRGSSVHLRAVASGLVTRGHEVVSLMSGPAAGPEPFPAPLRGLSSIEDVLRAADEAGAPDVIYERYAIGDQARLMTPNCNHSRHSELSAGFGAAEKIGCPFVLEVNSPLILESLRHRGKTPAPRDYAGEKTLMCGADAVVAVSEPMRRYVVAVRGSDKMVVTAHNGFHPELFHEPARMQARPQVIAFCGTPRPWHGLDYVPSLLARLGARGLRPVARIIGGPAFAGDFLAELELERVVRLSRGEGVESQLDLVGAVTQVEAAKLLSTATVGLAPYPPDPFFYFSPIKVFEYMGAGLPVVSTAQGDVADVVGDGGRVVVPGDLDALTDALEQILRNPRLALDLGARARKRAFENFTWSHTIEKLEMLFQRLLEPGLK